MPDYLFGLLILAFNNKMFVSIEGEHFYTIASISKKTLVLKFPKAIKYMNIPLENIISFSFHPHNSDNIILVVR